MPTADADRSILARIVATFLRPVPASLAMACAAIRLVRGPRAQDRILGLDTLYVNAMLMLLTFGIRTGSTLSGMVIVGGVAPQVWPPSHDELARIADDTATPLATVAGHAMEVYWIDRPHQDWIARNLSQFSDLISRLADDHSQLVNKLESIAAIAGTAT